MSIQKRSREDIAQLIAQDIPRRSLCQFRYRFTHQCCEVFTSR